MNKLDRATVETIARIPHLYGASHMGALAEDWLYKEEREQKIRKLLGHYPEMDDAEAANAAGAVAALFFAEQGASHPQSEEEKP